jgi:hypothetical protein
LKRKETIFFKREKKKQYIFKKEKSKTFDLIKIRWFCNNKLYKNLKEPKSTEEQMG